MDKGQREMKEMGQKRRETGRGKREERRGEERRGEERRGEERRGEERRGERKGEEERRRGGEERRGEERRGEEKGGRRKKGGRDERRKEGERDERITLIPDFCVYIQLLSMRTHTSIHNHIPFQDGKEGGGACHLGRLSGQPDHITHGL